MAATGSPPGTRTTPAGLLGVARAPFLPLAVLLALSGGLAQAGGAPQPGRLAVAVLGLVAAHVLVNVLNELGDDASGLDLQTQRTPFSGGSGALQQGQVTRHAAWALAAVSGALALMAAGLALGLYGEWRLLPVLLGGAASILLYTPWLLRLGLGEVAAGLGLGGLPVLGAALLQGGPVQPVVWPVALAATAMTFTLLLFNTVPDLEPDRRAGRRSLVHRVGLRGVAALGLLAWGVATGALAWAWVQGLLPKAAAATALPALVLLWPLLKWLRAGAPLPIPLPLLALNVVHNLATHAVLAAAWWWGA